MQPLPAKRWLQCLKLRAVNDKAMQATTLKRLSLGASISLILLITLTLSWELFLAPLKVGGSMLVLKSAVLLWPLMGILKGVRYTYQWSSMLILLYFMEGTVRAWSDVGLSQQLAMIEVVLSTIFFFCAIFYAKYITKQAQ